MKKSKIFILFLALLTMFIIVACSSDTDDNVDANTDVDNTDDEDTNQEEDNVTGKEIRVAFYQQPPSLDVPASTATAAGMIGRHMFEGLMALTSDYESVPMLAESVDQSDDGKVYTFNLRQGVMFHNGKEMVAEDVVASMERWLEKNPSLDLLFGGSTWEEDGDYIVVLTLQEAVTGVLDALAPTLQAPAIMPKEVVEAADETGVTEFVGTGPYKFVEWAQDQHIHLTKFDDYQSIDMEPDGFAGRKEALVEDIYFEIVSDATTRLAGLTSGQYDVAYSLSSDDYDQLESNPDTEIYATPSGHSYLIFNEKEPSFFVDPDMRKAVNLAVNAHEIMLGGFANESLFELDHSLMSKHSASWASNAGEKYFNQQNLDEARSILEEKGYDGEEVTILTDRSIRTLYGMGVVVQEQLEQIGLQVNLDVYDWATVSELRNDPANWDFYLVNVPAVNIPAQILPLSATWPGWADGPELVQLHQDILTAGSDEEAREVWDDLQEYVWSEYLPAIKFGNYYSFDAASNNIEGVTAFNSLILWNTTKVE